MKKILAAALAAFFVSGAPVKAAPVQNEIMFMLDSSGGLFDPAYNNWNAQIGWVQNFIDQTHRADGSNAYGIMTFGGENPNLHDYQSNIDNGGVKVLHSLWPGVTNPHPDGPLNPSSEQQPANLAEFTSGITNSDFLGGFTRTTDALNFVHNQFQAFSDSSTNKYIFMLTDGGFTSGFIPDDGQGVVSPELQALRDDGFTIAAVGVDLFPAGVDLIGAMISDPSLLFTVSGNDDFSNFLPSSSVAMPAPGAAVLLAFGAVFLARRRPHRHKTVI